MFVQFYLFSTMFDLKHKNGTTIPYVSIYSQPKILTQKFCFSQKLVFMNNFYEQPIFGQYKPWIRKNKNKNKRYN